MIGGEERAKYAALFQSLDPEEGYLTGDQAQDIFSQSDLDSSTLSDIWTLSDVDEDGLLDVGEFILAMHLINLATDGNVLPDVLPDDINPKIPVDLSPLDANMFQKYKELFIKFVGDIHGFLSPGKAHIVLLKSKLPKIVLAQIWKLSDHDCDNKLSLYEFALSMHLASIAKSGYWLPSELPPHLLGLVESEEQAAEEQAVEDQVFEEQAAVEEQPAVEEQSEQQSYQDANNNDTQETQTEPEAPSDEPPPIPEEAPPVEELVQVVMRKKGSSSSITSQGSVDRSVPRRVSYVDLAGAAPLTQEFPTYASSEYGRSDSPNVQTDNNGDSERTAFEHELAQIREEEAQRENQLRVQAASYYTPATPEPPRQDPLVSASPSRHSEEIKLATEAIASAQSLSMDKDRLEQIERKRAEREERRAEKIRRRSSIMSMDVSTLGDYSQAAHSSDVDEARKEQQRKDDLQRQREEATRLAVEKARQEERSRLAAELASKEEQLRQQEYQRLREQEQLEDQMRLEAATRIAVERAIAEERAKAAAEMARKEDLLRAEERARLEASQKAEQLRRDMAAKEDALRKREQDQQRQQAEARRKHELLKQEAEAEAQARVDEEKRLERIRKQEAFRQEQQRAMQQVQEASVPTIQSSSQPSPAASNFLLSDAERKKLEEQREVLRKHREEQQALHEARNSAIYARRTSNAMALASSFELSSAAAQPAPTQRRNSFGTSTSSSQESSNVQQSPSRRSSASDADRSTFLKRQDSQRQLEIQRQIEEQRQQQADADWRAQQSVWVPPSHRVGVDASHTEVETPTFKAKLFEQGVVPAQVIPSVVSQPVATPASRAESMAEQTARGKAEQEAKKRELAEYASRHVAQEEDRRRRESNQATIYEQDDEIERQSLKEKLAKFRAAESAVISASARAPVGRSPSSTNVDAPPTFQPLVATPGKITSERTQYNPNLLPASYISQPRVLSVSDFLPKQSVVPKGTVNTAPSQQAAPAPAPTFQPVVETPAAPVSQGKITSQRNQYNPDLPPASSISQPRVLAAGAFFPKQSVVPKASPVAAASEPVAAPAPAPTFQPIGQSTSSPGKITSQRNQYNPDLPPASSISQPRELAAGAFFPKQSVVPKGTVNAAPAQQAAPAPAPTFQPVAAPAPAFQPVGQSTSSPGKITSERTQYNPNLLPASYISQPRVLSVSDFLPKQSVVPKGTVNTAPSQQTAPAPAPTFQPVVETPAPPVSQGKITSQRNQYNPDLPPASSISQPRVLAAGAFFPKQSVVPKASPVAAAPEPVAAPAPAPTFQPIGQSTSSPGKITSERTQYNPNLLPASYISQPRVLSVSDFLPKQSVVPKGTVNAAPAQQAAPAPVPEPVAPVQTFSSPVVRALGKPASSPAVAFQPLGKPKFGIQPLGKPSPVASQRTEVDSVSHPASYVSQPQVLSKNAFMPKQYVVPK